MLAFARSPWPWLAVYLLLLALMAWGVLAYRAQVLSAAADEQRMWNGWLQAAEQQSQRPGPVTRERPSSDEPPMLVLMRDNFPAMFVGAMVFAGLITGFLLLVARGVAVQSLAPPTPDKSENAR